MSLILCLETSAKACTVALGQNGACLASLEAEGEMMHSKTITLLIERLLAEQGHSIKDIAAVAVSQGPGSYTGLRVGASCAKGLCFAQDIPLISIPTLEIIAAEYSAEALEDDIRLIPMIDARRMEVYYNIYDTHLHTEQETTNLVIDALSFDKLKGAKLLFCGDGAHKMSEYLDGRTGWKIQPSYAKASTMTTLAQRKLESGLIEDTAYYVPFYLKPPNITKSTKSLF